MSQDPIEVTRDYLQATYERGRKAMHPPGFEVDWDDQPSRFKIYPGVERVPLCEPIAEGLGSLDRLADRLDEKEWSGRALDFRELSTLLTYANGILARRVAVNWNGDSLTRTLYDHANYGRGTPSGGGMYPTEIYLACGPGTDLRSGLYHYDNAHHSLERLSRRDPTPRVRSALLDAPAASAGHFLLLTLNFWKNAFKYNNFCYHVVTQDLGAMVGSMRMLALAMGSDLEMILWHQDRRLDQMLGLDSLSESVFAVIPLDLAGGGNGLTGNDATQPVDAVTEDEPLVTTDAYQRSREVVRFPMIEDVHRAALIDTEERPSVESVERARPDVPGSGGDVRVALPERRADLLGGGLIDTFRRRRSSFGRFSSHEPMTLDQLTNILHVAAASRRYRTDLKRPDGTPVLSQLMVVANHVEGLDRGAYSYDHGERCLWALHNGDLTAFLQRSYFLQNYNLDQCAAVIALAGAVEPMLEALGSRGYRILNLEVGLVVQSIYLVANGMGLGCGAILGLDNLRMNQLLEVEGTDQDTLLFVMVGNHTAVDADYDYLVF